MAVTVTIYNAFKLKQFNGNSITLGTGVKVALFTSSLTPVATDTLYSGYSNEVANGNGYTTGGNALVSPSFSGTSTVLFTFTNPTWTFTASKTMRYAVIYDSASSDLIAWIDFGSDQTSSAVFTIALNASGLLSISSS